MPLEWQRNPNIAFWNIWDYFEDALIVGHIANDWRMFALLEDMGKEGKEYPQNTMLCPGHRNISPT